MNELMIENLFDNTHECASFHDARIKSVKLDYVSREAIFDCVLYVGNPDIFEDRERTAEGTLTITGFLYCVIEAPDHNYNYDDNEGLDVTSDGPLKLNEFRAPLPQLPLDLPENAFIHYFYLNNCNSFLYIAATGATFQWT